MKKLLTIVGLLSLNICASAQMTEVRGVIKSKVSVGKQVVYLYQIEDGETKLIKAISAAGDGFFSFSFEPAYEGFYMIGGATTYAGQSPLYLKKGDEAQVSIENRKLEFVGNQTDENTVLGSWCKVTAGLQNTVKDFKLINDKAKTFQKKGIRTKNEKFNLLMKQFVGFDRDFYALNLIKRNEGLVKEKSISKYCKNLIAEENVIGDDVFSYPNGKALVILYADYAASVNKVVLSTNRQKGTYVFNRMEKKLQSYPEFVDMMKTYGNLFQYPTLKAKVDAIGARLYNATPGREGANFSFPDKDGKVVSLSDLKGKVVLVDVWATYCGPCKELIPHLNKLETELHDNKDIVFVSVAQDGPRAKDTWLKLIKDQHLGGIQLFAGGADNILSNEYKIKVMPRYLIFDSNGNVVTAEAPLPGNPELKKILLAEARKIKGVKIPSK